MEDHGFTLLELLIALCVLMITLAIGIPSFSNQIQSLHVRTTAYDLLESVNHTRTLAVSHGKRATLRHRGSWEQGWDIFIDENDNGTLDEDEVLIQQRGPLKSVIVKGNKPLSQYVSFIASGESRYVGKAGSGAFQAGTFTVCPATSGAGYSLVLARSGRLRMESITEAECSAS